MPKPNGQGGWDLTDEDAAEILEWSDLERCRAATDRLADSLSESRADADRLRVIVDLACLEHEALFAIIEVPLGTLERDRRSEAHYDARSALTAAVAAEVTRRYAVRKAAGR